MNFPAIRSTLSLSSSLVPAARARVAARPMKHAILALGLALAGSLAACAPQGSFREVKVAQGGGEVALDGDRTLAHQKAEDYMKSKCQAGYTILEEGEATVGTDTTSSSSGARAHGFTIGGNRNKSSTRDATEWRVKYQCKDASAAPAAGAAPAAPASGASLASPKSERVGEIQEVRVRM
jgi:hypothetical protein